VRACTRLSDIVYRKITFESRYIWSAAAQTTLEAQRTAVMLAVGDSFLSPRKRKEQLVAEERPGRDFIHLSFLAGAPPKSLLFFLLSIERRRKRDCHTLLPSTFPVFYFLVQLKNPPIDGQSLFGHHYPFRLIGYQPKLMSDRRSSSRSSVSPGLQLAPTQSYSTGILTYLGTVKRPIIQSYLQLGTSSFGQSAPAPEPEPSEQISRQS